MPSNEQRREAAKRKLERQLARRAEKARKRQQLTIAGSIVAVIAVVGAGVLVWTLTKGEDDAADNQASTSASPSVSDQAPGVLPAGRKTPLAEQVNCTYSPQGQPAKPNNPPRPDGILTSGPNAKASVSIETNQGNIGLTLDNDMSPCTVNSFVSLASQGFFDGTGCHRLTTGEGLKVLQCGDPTGTGTGGPGYKFANEFPTDQYDQNDPALQAPVPYKRGVIAMANSGPNTNGSQFFLVYGDSQLPPNYTIFGTIDETGLQTLDKVAAAGTQGGAPDGKPAQTVTITSAKLD